MGKQGRSIRAPTLTDTSLDGCDRPPDRRVTVKERTRRRANSGGLWNARRRFGENVADTRTIAATRNSGKPKPLTSHVANSSRYGGLRKLTLFQLASHGDPDGSKIYPSLKRIAHYTGLDVRSVRRHVRAFQADGVLAKVADARQHHPAEYRLDIDALRADSGVRSGRADSDALRADSGAARADSEAPPDRTRESANHSIPTRGPACLRATRAGRQAGPPDHGESAREGAPPPVGSAVQGQPTDGGATTEWEEMRAREASMRRYLEKQIDKADDRLESAFRVLTGREWSDEAYDLTAQKAEEYHRELIRLNLLLTDLEGDP